jgi:hypothetical protein
LGRQLVFTPEKIVQRSVRTIFHHQTIIRRFITRSPIIFNRNNC